ncbi:MAG: P-loop NTPase, partial [Clostridia bacterium]|nr:P-loop NTPase [Clostridia bacterium]
TPQELVGMIVEKAVKMAKMMNVPVVGIVENMSYFQCPDCGGQHYIYGPSRVQEKAQQYGIPYMAKIPVDPAITAAVDHGMIETIHAPFMDDLLNGLLNK